MYLEYFGLRERPFNVTSDPAFLYLTKRHREALSHLVYGIKERKGFIEITGEIGTGKTTLCRGLLRELDHTVKTAFILNSNLPAQQMLQAIIEDFGLHPSRRNKLDLLNTLNQFLLEQLTIGNNTVIIVDEAQNLSISMLEQLRMLSNLETDKDKLVQLVLVGQPQLREKLNAPQLQQLRQRIAVRYHITPLEQDELRLYIEHRLRVAGSDGGLQLTDEALDAVYRYSGGVPRLINIICDKMLLACYVFRTKTFDGPIAQRCIEELEGQIAA